VSSTSLTRPRSLVLVAFVLAVLIAAPVAWAVGWTNVGTAGTRFNDNGVFGVQTQSPVYSSMLRLYVSTHSPCGGNNFFMGYSYPDHTIYAQTLPFTECTAAQTPTEWDVAGGNKYAVCGEGNSEPTDPQETCQRYSTT
jgi:hypothetical protein